MTANQMRQAVLIDTDIGDDVDDAFGLALALSLPSLDVRGVTTVCGPVVARARLAQVILAAAGRADVPVAPGCGTMSDGRAGPARFSHQSVLEQSGIGDWRLEIGHPHQSPTNLQFPTGSTAAVDLILDCSRGDCPLTLIAIGPLTNVAAALERDPSLARRARLVAMGGKLGLPYPDWNLRCDPAAARRVLASGMPTTLVGMHVTLRSKLRSAQLRSLFADRRPLAVALTRCVLAWRTWQRRMPILHDALTVAVAAEPSIARLGPRHVRVGWVGFSVAGRRGAPNALVCTGIDLERFHAILHRHLLAHAVEESWRRTLVERVAERIA